MTSSLSVDNVLCYISTARHSFTDEVISSACISFYKLEDITAAKETLFRYANESLKNRRGENRIKADVLDIIALFRKCDENDVELPKFLSDGWNKMPPSNGFEVIAEHILSLMDELSSIKSQLNTVQSENLSSGVTEIREDLRDVKLLLRRDSVRLQGSVPGTSSQNHNNSTRTERNTSVNNSQNSEHMTTENSTNRPLRSHTNPPTGPSTAIEDSSFSSAATADDNAMHSEPATSQEWTLVQRRKPKKYLTGSKASASGALQGLH